MVVCHCGRFVIVRTSWTDQNPGRRFYSCPMQGTKCQFIGWVDPPMCPRSKEIIPGLLKSKNKVDLDMKTLEAKIRTKNIIILLLILSFTTVICVLLLLMYL
ncbi:hypothetical protein R6Q59_014240 [Mikania micrantha]